MSIEICDDTTEIKPHEIFHGQNVFWWALEQDLTEVDVETYWLIMLQQIDVKNLAIHNENGLIGVLLLTECHGTDWHCCLNILLKENVELTEEIFKTAVNYVFKQPFNKIYLRPTIRNKKFRQLANQLGFRKIGTRIQHRFTGRRYIDVQDFEMLKENWAMRVK